MKNVLNDNIKILLVEDNPGDALLIKEALKESSYSDANLFVAQSLKEARAFSVENILLVLADLGLPDSDGLETVKHIHEYFPDSALIVLTGLEDEKIALETLREGAQNYLNKNEIDNRVLDKTIRFSLERHLIIQKLKAVIIEHSKAEEKLIKANRLYSFISAINQSIVHIKDEQELLDKACNIAIEIGLFKTAWIGMLDEKGLLNMVSLHGDQAIIKDMMKYSGMDYSRPELLNTTTGKALSTGKYEIKNDFPNDSDSAANRETFIKHGIKSTMSFPIKKSGSTVGVFGFQSDRENFFDEEEIALLEETAGDISFALEIFEKEKQRTKAEKNLEFSEARLKDAQLIALIGSWEIDMLTNKLYWSDEYFNILGFKKGDVEPSSEIFLSMIHPDDAEFVNKGFIDTFTTFENSSSSFRIVLLDGTIKYVFCEWKFEFDKDKIPVRIFGIIQDITERKLAEEEREKITADIIQRNKDLEQFSYIISHNLRAPVANILGLSTIIRDEDLEAGEAKKMMDGLYNCVNRIDEVIIDLNTILNIRREVTEKKEIIHFSKLVTDTKASIQNIIKRENAVVIVDFSEVDEMLTLKSYMQSIFYNLISNSLKYKQPHISAVIEIQSRRLKNKIVLMFKDNGMGIDLEKKGNQVFGLYKRFHVESAEGKGIGLFMVKTQVETIGGKINIQSEVNKGTTFRLEFES